MKILRFFLAFVPLALAAEWLFHSPALAFVSACLGLLPLAGAMGEATEQLAHRTGERVGGLLNATLGNSAELIITVVALRAGKVELVKASIVGSILGNLLLILGLSLLAGGLKNGLQRFDPRAAGTASTMMLLSVIGLLIPTLFEIVHKVQHHLPLLTESPDPPLDRLSLGIAGVLIVVYALARDRSRGRRDPRGTFRARGRVGPPQVGERPRRVDARDGRPLRAPGRRDRARREAHGRLGGLPRHRSHPARRQRGRAPRLRLGCDEEPDGALPRDLAGLESADRALRRAAPRVRVAPLRARDDAVFQPVRGRGPRGLGPHRGPDRRRRRVQLARRGAAPRRLRDRRHGVSLAVSAREAA